MKLTLILLAGCLLTPSSAIAEELFQKSPNTQNISTKTNLVAAWNPVKNKTSDAFISNQSENLTQLNNESNVTF